MTRVHCQLKMLLWQCLPYPSPQLEDIDVLVADHVQRVHKTNFLASWDEIGDECEMQDTYALTQMASLEGRVLNPSVSLCVLKVVFENLTWKSKIDQPFSIVSRCYSRDRFVDKIDSKKKWCDVIQPSLMPAPPLIRKTLVQFTASTYPRPE